MSLCDPGQWRRWSEWLASDPRMLMTFFILANFLNFIDRGIIPGASSEFNAFIKNSAELEGTSSVDTWLGLLQSMFIVGYSIAACIFGNMVHTHPPFLLVGIGLSVWCVSAVLAGLSEPTGSYVLLAGARMLSGVGEASFQVVSSPYIQDNSGAHTGFWLGLFYTAIPFGTAVGYGYAAVMATSPFGWPGAFFLEAIVMTPLALFCFLLPRDVHSKSKDGLLLDTLEFDGEEGGDDYDREAYRGVSEDGSDMYDASEPRSSHLTTSTSETPSIVDEVMQCLRRPLFVSNALGYAAYGGGIIGFSTFGPAFAMGLGYYAHETSASMIFGGVMAVAGLVGTPIGGAITDKVLARFQEQGRTAAEAAASLACVINVLGTGIVLGTVFAQPLWLFMGSLGIGAACLFVTTTPMNLATLESVPAENRPFAMGFSTLLMHAFGDVPSPVVIGALKDWLAPHCTPSTGEGDDDDAPAIDDGCVDERDDLRVVLLAIVAWLSFSGVMYGFSWWLCRHLPTEKGVPGECECCKRKGRNDENGLKSPTRDHGINND